MQYFRIGDAKIGHVGTNCTVSLYKSYLIIGIPYFALCTTLHGRFKSAASATYITCSVAIPCDSVVKGMG